MRHAPSGVQSKAGCAPRIDKAVVSRPECIKTGLAHNSHRTYGTRGYPSTARPRRGRQGASRRA
eukprot:1689038-Pyramimonas_sp.AAC.1